VVVVEAGVGAARELHDALAHDVRQATVAGPAAVGVSQSRLPSSEGKGVLRDSGGRIFGCSKTEKLTSRRRP
jgi:hypothetical protein